MKLIKSQIQKLQNWAKANRKEFYILVIILLVGAVMRLYKIDQYMTFLGDEGRDAVVVRKLLLYADPILVGPGTSIGNMYLGPLYYYFIAPALLLANFSPAGPSILIALVGIVTIGFLYKVAREWFGVAQAILAASLYAISPTVIIYARSSWNPNIMPFFSLLAVYAIYEVWQKKSYRWLIALGVSYAFVLQSHYLGLLLGPVLGLFYFLTFLTAKKQKTMKPLLVNSAIGLAIFLFLMSPLVIFDARHGWNNFSAIKKFFTERETTVSIKPWKALPGMWPIYEEITTRLVGGRDKLAGKLMAFGVFGLVALNIIRTKGKNLLDPRMQIVLVWLITAIGGLALYKQHIYDHYYGFFFVAPFLLFGIVFVYAWQSKFKFVKWLLAASFLALVFVNLKESPLKYAPNMQLQRAQEVAKKVIDISEGRKFNFALIAERNYEAGYRYYLDVYGAQVVDIDPLNTSSTIQDQLIVVCENEKPKCDPTHNAKAEVANFGWSKIDQEWEVMGVTIYKLVHAK